MGEAKRREELVFSQREKLNLIDIFLGFQFQNQKLKNIPI